MKTLAILDTETTGLDPAKDTCIEVACVLYSVEHAAPIASFASLMATTSNDAEAVNRIPVPLLVGAPANDKVWKYVAALIARADAVVAHRAEFDRSFVPPELRDLKPWICSKFDIPWPLSKPGDGLVHVALAHGVGVMQAHRALTDCDTLARIFQRVAEMGADVPGILARAMRPKSRYVALVSFEDREKAKAAGFQWDGARKQWHRTMARDDVDALGFETREQP